MTLTYPESTNPDTRGQGELPDVLRQLDCAQQNHMMPSGQQREALILERIQI